MWSKSIVRFDPSTFVNVEPSEVSSRMFSFRLLNLPPTLAIDYYIGLANLHSCQEDAAFEQNNVVFASLKSFLSYDSRQDINLDVALCVTNQVALLFSNARLFVIQSTLQFETYLFHMNWQISFAFLCTTCRA